MKKLVILILGVLFLIPLSVKADMGPPEIKSYKATPISKDGAIIYDKIYGGNPEKKDTLKYGDEVVIVMEEIEGGKTYGYFYDNGNGEDGYVLLSEMKYVSRMDELDEQTPKYTARVFADDGVDLYEGPSFIYDKITTIPKGTNIKSTDYSESDGEWLYVEYNGKTGYVSGADETVGVLYSGAIADPNKTNIINNFYKFSSWSSKFGYKSGNDYKVVNKLWKGLGGVPKNASEATAKSDLTVEDKLENGTSIGTIKKGDKFEILYDVSEIQYVSYLVKSGDVQGWVSYHYDTEDNNVDANGIEINWEYSKPVLYDENDPEDKPIVDPNEKPKKDTKKGFFDGWTKREIILVSIIGGIVIVLVAVVTLVLVNKKKNKGVQA